MKSFLNKPGFLLLTVMLTAGTTAAQEQTVMADTATTVPKAEAPLPDSGARAKPVNYPKKAAIRSALFPGLGQIYNKKYWKLPIVYGALGTSAGIFMYNLKYYRKFRLAYRVKYNINTLNDSTDYNKVDQTIFPLSIETLRVNRDEFRRNIDYSVLAFIVLWGLNVVDAAVDAHLRSFDVTPDISLKVKPAYNPAFNTAGLSLVFTIGKNSSARKLITLK